MNNPYKLQIIAGILLLLGAVLAGAAGAPIYSIPIFACLFVLVEIARGKYTLKTSGGSSENIKMVFGLVFLLAIQSLIAWGLLSLGGFLAKLMTGDSLAISWYWGLSMVAVFAVLPFLIPSLRRKELINSILEPAYESIDPGPRKTIHSAMLGELTQHEQFDDWWTSSELYVPCLEKELSITYTDCEIDSTEQYLLEADENMAAFLQMNVSDIRKYTPEVKADLDMNIEATDYGEEFPFMHLEQDQDVWKYIRADHIYLNAHDDDMLISIVYNCDWEEEHGFQLDFKNVTELVYAGAQH